MNREHDAVARNLSSPDATPASTWNRGNAFRHLALAGWDPSGLSEREHLLEALKYIEVEIDRVEARDRMLKEEKPQDAPAGWPNDYTSQIPTGSPYPTQQPLYFPPGVRATDDDLDKLRTMLTSKVPNDAKPALPSCSVCGKELYQDPQRDYKLVCPDGHYQNTVEQPQIIATHPVPTQPAPVAGRTVLAPSTAFQKYQRGPVDQLPVIPGDRTQRLQMPEKTEPQLTEPNSAVLALGIDEEALVQGADPEPSA